MGVCLVLVVHAPNVAPLGLGAGAVEAGNKRYPPATGACDEGMDLFVDTRGRASVRENMPSLRNG